MIEAVVCIHVQVFAGHRFSLLVGKLSGSGIVGSHGVHVLFYRKLPSFPRVSVLFGTCTGSHESSPSSVSSQHLVLSGLLTLLCISLKGKNCLSTRTRVHVDDRKVNLSADRWFLVKYVKK